ncbi:hypothetical protein NESM_000420400 [Novymonas esmeraldas]|uniref:PH domain-containing protein n=1 Tax=Novymonas esmeraldas TaxID=1808958 RepID=A0AAW0ELJ4_9TRYP
MTDMSLSSLPAHRDGVDSLPPPATWMWKPRSKLVDADGNPTHATALLHLRRIGARQWHRRFVFVDGDRFCYVAAAGRRGKEVPFERIESVRREPMAAMRRERAPGEYVAFGWCLAVQGRTLYFCAESEQCVRQWVSYLEALLQRRRSRGAAAVAPLAAPHDGVDLPRLDAPARSASTAPVAPRCVPATAADDGAAVASSPALVEVDVEAAGGDDTESDGVLDVSSDDTEGEDATEDDGAGASHRSSHGTTPLNRGGPSPAPSDAVPSTSPRQQWYAPVLLSVAAEPHTHISSRVPALAPHFRSGDDVGSVVFSCAMEKIGKRDNAQPREVVLTTRHLYLFSKSRLGAGLKLRCIDVRDVTGVVESTTDRALVAMLVPTFHDVLLRAPPQDSGTPGAEVDVRRQLVAHLYKAHCDTHTDHRFLFGASAAVAKAVRRTTEARYPPIAVRDGDQMRVGEHPALLPTFAKNADEAVYWSSMVRQVRADRAPHLRALVVTEGSLYTLADTLQTVERRACLDDLLAVEYDADAQTILLQCRGVDTLFSVQSSMEFDALLRVLPEAVADGAGRVLRLAPSKQLYSHAHLIPVSSLHGASATSRRHRRSFAWHVRWRAGGADGTRLLASIAGRPAEAEAGTDADVDDAGGEDGAGDYSHGIHGDHGHAPALRRLCAQLRLVEEVLQEYDDVEALLRHYDAAQEQGYACWDGLQLRRALAVRGRVGDVCLSAACRLLDAKECGTLARPAALELDDGVVGGMGTARAVCVTTVGFVFLRHGAAASLSATPERATPPPPPSAAPRGSGSLVRDTVRSRLGSVAAHVVGGGKDDDLLLHIVEWSSVAAVVRCHRLDGTSVALLTNRAHPTDYLFHLENAAVMCDVITAAVGCHARRRHGASPQAHLLPVFAAPSAQGLAAAVKRTLYDPMPTVALRYTPRSFASDRLRMAFVPDVADACRRFGDNTVYFSGVAWRVRSATLRRCGGRLDADPGHDMRRHNNHLYKSLILIITNVAVYHCTKGGFEVVRRTVLTDIAGIVVGLHDPDTVLLSVPAEYDMYFRVEGRGPELVARLREAHAEWGSDGERPLSARRRGHAAAAATATAATTGDDDALPLHRVAFVAAEGALTKPAHFNDLQSSRSAADCQHLTRQWHLQALRRAIAGFTRAQAVARGERRHTGSAALTWRDVRGILAERQALLYRVQRRCFRFGLTDEVCEEMLQAQALLAAFAALEAAAAALVQAARGDDLVLFHDALRYAASLPDLRLLVREEASRHERHRARCQCITAIVVTAQQHRHQPPGRDSMAVLEAALLDRFAEAHRLGCSPVFMRRVAQVVRVLVQRAQLQRIVCDPSSQARLCAVGGGRWALVLQAAREVGMTSLPSETAAAATAAAPAWLISVRLAHVGLARAAASGDAAVVRGAVKFADCALGAASRQASEDVAEDAGTIHALRRATEATRAEYAEGVEEERQQLWRHVQCLAAARQLHQRRQSWTMELVAGMLKQCAQLETQLIARGGGDGGSAAQGVLVSVLALERNLLTEVQHGLAQQRAQTEREVEAERQHKRERDRLERVLERAASRRQRREAVRRSRLQRLSLESWGERVREVTNSVEATLVAEERDDEGLRQGIKQCAHLERWISDAGARCGLVQPNTGAVHDDGALWTVGAAGAEKVSDTAPVEGGGGERAVETLVAQLHDVSNRAEELLTRPVRGEAGSAAAAAHWCDAADGAAVLPREVERLLEAGDSAGLVVCIRACASDASAESAAVVKALQQRWQLARHRQRWVRSLHRRLHAAAVLHSRALLERELQVASDAAYSDTATETARRLLHVMAVRGTSAGTVSAAVSAGGRTAAAPPPSAASVLSGAAAALGRAAGAADSSKDAPACLRQLSAAMAAVADHATRVDCGGSCPPPSSSPSPCSGTEAAPPLLHVEPSNPHCAAYVAAWRAALQHGLRPSGAVGSAPRTVWGLVRDVGALGSPLVAQLAVDFRRLFRSGGDDGDEAARRRSDTVLVSLVLLSRRMSCVVRGVAQLEDDEARRGLLLPESVLAQPGPLRALVAAADVSDQWQWDFPSVQALAVECLFPTAAPTTPAPSVVAARRTRAEAIACSIEEMRCAVHAVADYFAGSLRTGDVGSPTATAAAAATAAASLDEHCSPAVGDLVDRCVLPAVMGLLTRGLRRQHPNDGTSTLWAALVALRELLSASARTLAGARMQQVMELVEALTDASGERGRQRRCRHLLGLSAGALDALRSRMFVRECMNRRELYHVTALLFPRVEGNEAWAGAESGVLWTLYDPTLCVLHPPDDAATAPLHATLRRLAAMPVALVVDRECR